MKSAAKRHKSGPNGSPEPDLLLPPGEATCAEAFLLLPGLNLDPARLEPLQDFLLGRGHAVIRPPLKGYPGAVRYAPPQQDLLRRAWGSLRAEDWLDDLDRTREALRRRFPEAAVSLVGYSMGAVLGLVWSLTRQQPFARAVMLAPALHLKWHLAMPLRVICALLPRRMRLPSLGPAIYLAHRGTSLAAYGALLELIDAFHRAAGPQSLHEVKQPPPLQFLAWHERDELISTAFLAHYASQAGERATTHALAHAPLPGATRHLGIDAHTLGDSEWAALLTALEAWLAR